jgi:hypothetical protein
MPRLLDSVSRRHGFDGWALQPEGSRRPLRFTACTTRAEARRLRDQMAGMFDRDLRVVKVRLEVKPA